MRRFLNNHREPPRTAEMKMQDLHNPARLPNESYPTYQMRRKFSKMAVNGIKKGRLIWDSARKGTYRRGMK